MFQVTQQNFFSTLYYLKTKMKERLIEKKIIFQIHKEETFWFASKPVQLYFEENVVLGQKNENPDRENFRAVKTVQV